MDNPSVLVTGAGPTGLVLAYWLARCGISVRIIDKTAEAGTTSRALAVQARTLEFYRQLGLSDAVVEGGVKITNLNLWVRGRIAARISLQRIGEGVSPFSFAMVFPQDVHERLLIERLEALGVKVERQTELHRFEQDDAAVRSTLKRPDGSEETCRTAYLAGCDGASSTVRESLSIGFPGGTYTGLFYVADVEAAGPETDDQLNLDLEDADFLMVFPLKGNRRFRLVGTVRQEVNPEQRKLTFDDVKGRAIEHLRLEVEKVNWFSTYRVHHRVAGRFRQGRLFLLGDAAHVHSPVGGQGMNTGIGDAVNLAWKLAAVLAGGARDDLLDTYEPERIAFARRLVATTDRVFTLVTKRGRGARFVRTRIVPRLMPVLFQLPPLRRFMFRSLSQIGIRYRDSALSEGRAHAVHGGDRLPWIRTEAEEDNFVPLASLNWQVHVYGVPPSGLEEACAELRLPVHVFSWRPEMRRAGLLRGALYLIRPDGYVALADPDGDPRRLRDYLTKHSLRT